MGRWLPASLLLMTLVPPPARAAIELCLELEAPPEQSAGLEKLVRDELARHPSHRLVEADCRSRLRVELFRLDRFWFLTARVAQQIPLRFRFAKIDDLEHHLREAISQALGQDPVLLVEDITRYSAIERAAHSLLKRGQNYLRLELFQGLGRAADGALFAPGGAFGLARGADHWQVMTRVFLAGWPERASGEEMVLSVLTGADGLLVYEFSARGFASFYAGAGLGLEYRRYQGLLDPADGRSIDYRNDFGPALSLRAGVRLLRYYSFDLDLFLQVRLPLYPADRDTQLSRIWAPQAELGMGVGL